MGEKLKAMKQIAVQLFKPGYMRQNNITKILEKRQAEAEHILLGRGTQNIEMPAGSSLLSMHWTRRLDPSLANELEKAIDGEVVIREGTVEMIGHERDIFFIARRDGNYAKVIAIDVTDARNIDSEVSVNKTFVEDPSHFDTIFETFLHTRPENGNGPGRIVNTAVEHKLGVDIEVNGKIEKLEINAFEGETLQTALKRSQHLIWKSTSLGDRIVGIRIPGGSTIMEDDKGQGWQIYLNDNLCLIIKDGKPVFLPPTEIYVNTSGTIKLKFERAMISDSEAKRYVAKHWIMGCLHSCTTAELRRTGGAVPISYFIGWNNQENRMLRMNVPERKRFEVSSVFVQLGPDIWLAIRARQMEAIAAKKRNTIYKELALETSVLQDKPDRKERHLAKNSDFESEFFGDNSRASDGIFVSVPQASQNRQKNGMAVMIEPITPVISAEWTDAIRVPTGAVIPAINEKAGLQRNIADANALQAAEPRQMDMHKASGEVASEKKSENQIGMMRGTSIRKTYSGGNGEARRPQSISREAGSRSEGGDSRKKAPHKPIPFSAISSFKAVIFDLDGVIVDSEMVHPRTFERALAKYGVKIKDSHWKRAYTGIGSYAIFEDLVKKYGIKEDARELVKKRNEIYLEEIKRNRLPVIEGFHEVHRLLVQSGVKEAVASGGHANHVEESLRSSGLKGVPFVAIEHVKRGKPAPEIFLRAAKRLRVKPSECIVFEDSLSGIEAAAAAGMPCVALSTTMQKKELRGRAALIVNNYRSKKLGKLLAALLAKREKGAQANGRGANKRRTARLRAPGRKRR